MKRKEVYQVNGETYEFVQEEPTEVEIHKYAKFLGLDVEKDSELLWIAREGLTAPLPENWKPCQTKKGELYYFNNNNGEAMWNHPLDEYYLNKVRDEKLKKLERKRVKEKLETSRKSNHEPEIEQKSVQPSLPIPMKEMPEISPIKKKKSKKVREDNLEVEMISNLPDFTEVAEFTSKSRKKRNKTPVKKQQPINTTPKKKKSKKMKSKKRFKSKSFVQSGSPQSVKNLYSQLRLEVEHLKTVKSKFEGRIAMEKKAMKEDIESLKNRKASLLKSVESVLSKVRESEKKLEDCKIDFEQKKQKKHELMTEIMSLKNVAKKSREQASRNLVINKSLKEDSIIMRKEMTSLRAAYDEILKSSSAKLESSKQEADELRIRMATISEEKKKYHDEFMISQQQISSKVQEIAILEEKVEKLFTSCSVKDAELKEMREGREMLVADVRRLQSERDENSGRCEELNNQLSEKNVELGRERGRNEELVRQHSEISNKNDALSSEVASLRDFKVQKSQQCENDEEKIGELESVNDELHKKFMSEKKRCSHVELQLSSSKDNSVVLNKKLGDREARILELTGTLEKSKGEVGRLRAREVEVLKQLDDLRVEHEKLQNVVSDATETLESEKQRNASLVKSNVSMMRDLREAQLKLEAVATTVRNHVSKISSLESEVRDRDDVIRNLNSLVVSQSRAHAHSIQLEKSKLMHEISTGSVMIQKKDEEEEEVAKSGTKSESEKSKGNVNTERVFEEEEEGEVEKSENSKSEDGEVKEEEEEEEGESDEETFDDSAVSNESENESSNNVNEEEEEDLMGVHEDLEISKKQRVLLSHNYSDKKKKQKSRKKETDIKREKVKKLILSKLRDESAKLKKLVLFVKNQKELIREQQAILRIANNDWKKDMRNSRNVVDKKNKNKNKSKTPLYLVEVKDFLRHQGRCINSLVRQTNQFQKLVYLRKKKINILKNQLHKIMKVKKSKNEKVKVKVKDEQEELENDLEFSSNSTTSENSDVVNTVVTMKRDEKLDLLNASMDKMEDENVEIRGMLRKIEREIHTLSSDVRQSQLESSRLLHPINHNHHKKTEHQNFENERIGVHPISVPVSTDADQLNLVGDSEIEVSRKWSKYFTRWDRNTIPKATKFQMDMMKWNAGRVEDRKKLDDHCKWLRNFQSEIQSSEFRGMDIQQLKNTKI